MSSATRVVLRVDDEVDARFDHVAVNVTDRREVLVRIDAAS
jgi:predicted transcriptional regulator